MKRLTGALVVALAVVMLALPIPFVGVPFGVATVVLATAYLERDGAVFVAALGDVPTFVEKRVRRAGDGDYAACGLWASAGGREDFRW